MSMTFYSKPKNSQSLQSQSDDQTKPLHFDLIDGYVDLMSVQYFMSMMQEVLQPIIASERIIKQSLTSINNRVDVWLEEQSDE